MNSVVYIEKKNKIKIRVSGIYGQCIYFYKIIPFNEQLISLADSSPEQLKNNFQRVCFDEAKVKQNVLLVQGMQHEVFQRPSKLND